ncbi:hypothetical protein AQI88_38210 [Streptomyces cellostaticus]|uniref:Secreted protein n=1 Tax=Streptomyces cellostaticus TaxID=67285 RepID=A0A117PTY0_9ACTN|nr:hypothetical protein [Streptomyces cellostaticus]KUM91163.1 hypothetical protein AQI88_38210 [Streptomyces cellostaticus]GHI02787.1 hypothetical protein Scel_11080 [Streptomyces cellostaticus]
MSTGTLLAIIIAIVVVLALAAAAVSLMMRRRHLRERFGPEYERTVEDSDSRRTAERELKEREKRHDALNIKPLSPVSRDRYTREWSSVQQEFVDRPQDAVHDADRLVTSLMHDRGYPTEGFDQQMKDLSVEHGRTLDHYRAAHEVESLSTHSEATTEQLRGAMVHYRALFDELLSDGGRAQPARS